MIFVRLYHDELAQASYLIGCAEAGTAVVIDPNRRVDQYIAAAESAGLSISAITETHIHADFVSGTRELASRTGAPVFLSACGPPEWQYEFRGEPGVTLLGDGDRVTVGAVELRTVHTPGHTPEHVSFLVTDRSQTQEPMGIVTGDFVFVNDVGRPDLLEKAASVAGSATAGARQLFTSLAWFKTLPDHLQVWPGHGAGSACGKGLSAVPQSTVGYERRFNWAFQAPDEQEFVRQVLAGQPEPPRYFAIMKRINRSGPPILGTVSLPERLPEQRLASLLESGAVVMDTRSAAEFASRHIPGTLNIPHNRSFPTWAGSLLPYDRDVYLITRSDESAHLERVVGSLRMVGLDRVTGYFGPEVFQLWLREGKTLDRLNQLSVSDVAARQKQLVVLDVRAGSEWDAGHLPGAVHIPLAELPDRLHEVPNDRAIAVHCQVGGRSAIAASLLRASGRPAVSNVTGGFEAWTAAGLPQRTGDET